MSAHVANSIVPNVKLVHGCVLSTLAENRFLHVTDVEDIRRRDYFRHEAVEVGSIGVLIMCMTTMTIGILCSVATISIKGFFIGFSAHL